MGVRFAILPLQSTKGHMQVIRTIDIGRHKQQRAMGACSVHMFIYLSDLREHLFTNKQPADQPTQKELS